MILKDLKELSKGRLTLPDDTELAQTGELLRQQQTGPKNDVVARKRGRSRSRSKRKKRH